MNNSSIFFIDKKRNKYSFNKFPEGLYIDTCYWIEYLGGNEAQFSRDCRNFINDCIDNEVILVSSTRVLSELAYNTKKAFITSKIRNKEISPLYYASNKINYKDTYKEKIITNDELYEEMVNEIHKDISIVQENTEFISYDSNNTFRNEMEKIKSKTKYVVEDRDAEHIAIARTVGINSIATCDGDYFATDNMNIFTVPTEKYKNSIYDGRANVFKEFDVNKY